MTESNVHIIWNTVRLDGTLIITSIECEAKICLLIETISKYIHRLGYRNNRIRLYPGETWTLEYDLPSYRAFDSTDLTYFLTQLESMANNHHITSDMLDKVFTQNVTTPAEYYGVDMSELARKGSRKYTLACEGRLPIEGDNS